MTKQLGMDHTATIASVLVHIKRCQHKKELLVELFPGVLIRSKGGFTCESLDSPVYVYNLASRRNTLVIIIIIIIITASKESITITI